LQRATLTFRPPIANHPRPFHKFLRCLDYVSSSFIQQKLSSVERMATAPNMFLLACRISGQPSTAKRQYESWLARPPPEAEFGGVHTYGASTNTMPHSNWKLSILREYGPGVLNPS
jgi:hypothetical protein